jgi:hypothetical protein
MTAPEPFLPELLDSTTVPFDQIFLDPNNPRIAPEVAPGYEDADALFNAPLQQQLVANVHKVYDVPNLEDSILAHGWVPIDAIIVWEHPSRPNHYVVVEGNTRVVALRRLRNERLEQERAKAQKNPTRFKEEIRQAQDIVARLENIARSTDQLRVYPVASRSAQELRSSLPRLLGVRHITHARNWDPYATNLYILSLYERAFREKYGEDARLELKSDLVKQVGDMVSLKELKTRRNIQAASAFTHFKRDYEERLPDGEELSGKDHYFFEQILTSAYPKSQFSFENDSLRMSPESEDVLFQWAFSKPRAEGGEEENPNILYKAESIGLWGKMATYDAKHGTQFSKQLDVNLPEQARPIRVIEAEFLHHKAQRTPIDALSSLIGALGELKVETLISQQDHLAPMLDEIALLVERYRKMIQVIA